MSKAEERIDRLQKRADHLRGRVAAAESEGRDLTFDKAELSALLWAIPLLRCGEALERDAARYRWMKGKITLFNRPGQWSHYVGDWISLGMDAAIDAAMSASGETEEKG